MNLSKSRYTNGVQCPKMLWMKQHMPEQFDESVLNLAILDMGSKVGDLAMGYYGDFVEVPFCDHGKQAMIDDTWHFLEDAWEGRGPVNIAEASFAYDGNFCSVDILRVEDDGVRIVEVKSSTHVNPIYYHDMAFQTWVLSQCGLNVKSVSLMHINRDYVRQGELDVQALFLPEDCTEKVMAMQAEVGERIPLLKQLADAPDEPDIAIGDQCKHPYECGFRGWCWRCIPKPSVFDLNRMTITKGLESMEKGQLTLGQIAAAGRRLSARQQVQVRAEVEGLDTIVDVPAVRRFLDTLTFPLYFLDFETFQPAVPLYDGTRPFQQIPSQYSLHVLPAPDAPLEHYEFLAEAGADPRRSVAEHLVADIPEGVCTLAYNMSFERGRISEMAAACPDLADHLLAINEGMRDLIVPFNAGSYYAKGMDGSNSIKKVLPALFPDDPELDYHNLDGVQNGAMASAAFSDLADMDPEDAARTRQQLLTYCELDTYAMVKIWQRLTEEVSA